MRDSLFLYIPLGMIAIGSVGLVVARLKSRNDVPNQDTESGSVLVRFRKGYGTGRVGSADQALVSDRARSGLGPSGFDPSRKIISQNHDGATN